MTPQPGEALRTIASRTWSDVYHELLAEGASDGNAMARADIVRIELEKRLAALAAPVAGEGLDVERLQRAMRPVKHRRTLAYEDGTESGFVEEYRPPTPEEVAREYAANQPVAEAGKPE